MLIYLGSNNYRVNFAKNSAMDLYKVEQDVFRLCTLLKNKVILLYDDGFTHFNTNHFIIGH